ncbi:tyrosine-type recombinase/integrase [Nannocystis pusilla]|uniref:tyrosine-type recombinase/integrase n=1 Tax=Nannocystis pusilla TaxID=889268 RepID=UPI003DA38124
MHIRVGVRKRLYPDGGCVWTADIRGVVPSGEELPDRFRLTAPAELKTAAAVRTWGWEQAQLIAVEGRPVQTRKGKAIADAKVKAEKAAQVPALAEYWPTYLEQCRSDRQRPSTIDTKESLARTHLLPVLGSRDLRSCCSQQALDEFKKHLQVLGHSRANSALTLLHDLLASAQKSYVLEVPEIEPVKADAVEEQRAYSREEYELMVPAARELGSRFLLPILLGGDAGLRVGEVIALRWTMVDLDLGALKVCASAWGNIVGPPKNGRPRTVPLTTSLKEALHDAPRTCEFVVNRARGDKGMANHASMESVIRAVVRRAGVTNRGSHGLRHLFAMRLIAAGVPINVVQKLLGHSKLATTAIYLGNLPGAEAAAVAALERGGVH